MQLRERFSKGAPGSIAAGVSVEPSATDHRQTRQLRWQPVESGLANVVQGQLPAVLHAEPRLMRDTFAPANLDFGSDSARACLADTPHERRRRLGRAARPRATWPVSVAEDDLTHVLPCGHRSDRRYPFIAAHCGALKNQSRGFTTGPLDARFLIPPLLLLRLPTVTGTQFKWGFSTDDRIGSGQYERPE